MIVCKTSFAGLHGISKSRVERLAKYMSNNVTSPPDLQGKHGNRPHAIPEDTIINVENHIRSFPRRKSHYSRKDNLKHYYLSSDLNIKKMHSLYVQKHEPEEYLRAQAGMEVKYKVSYDFYYRFFTTNFSNISFGKPRSDTCQKCDILEKKMLEAQTEEEKKSLRIQKDLHLRKAELFYSMLKEKTSLSKADETVETICFDFEQNMALPTIPSGDVFYSRQLWIYSFCIHVSSTHKSYFYMYDESTGKKSPNEVISFLDHFFATVCKKSVSTFLCFQTTVQHKIKTTL